MTAISLPNWFGAKLPSFARDYMFRSIAYYEKGRFEEALRDADRSVALEAREATAFHHRGNVLFALNRLDEAAGAYVEALKLSPGEGAIWNNLGAALQNSGRTKPALEAFQRATTCKPPSLNAFVGMAVIEIQAGNFDKAAEALTYLEEHNRPTATTMALRSVIAGKLGSSDKADSLAQQARILDPDAAAWAFEQISLAEAKGRVP